MTDRNRIPNPGRVREEACAWIARLDAGLSAEQRRDLEEWLAADASHCRALIEMARRWDDASVLAELAELFPLERYSRASQHRWRRRLAVGVACVLAAVAVAWYAPILMAPFVTGASTPTAQIRSYETAVGERSTVALPDGTTVTLNTNSVLDVHFTGGERDVVLRRGEAYFNVARDAARPFRVYAGERICQAVGTSFNVRLQSADAVELTVVEGKVRVFDAATAGAQKAAVNAPRRHEGELMVAGELALLQHAAPAVKQIDPAEIETRLAWREGMIVFNGDTLDVVLQEVARYTTVEFVLSDASLRTVKVGGYFRAGDIDGLRDALRLNFGIESHVAPDNRIILSAQ